MARISPRVTRHASRDTRRGFTLIELLVVLSIMGILAALAVPAIKNFGRAEAQVAATRQLVDDVHRARALAMSLRTTVYMVFLPAGFWSDSSYSGNASAFNSLSISNKNLAEKLYDKQLNSYAFVSLRSVGDQPGQNTARYIGAWHSLPEGMLIAPWKFRSPDLSTTPIQDPPLPASPSKPPFDVRGFNITTRAADAGLSAVQIPFPSAEGSTGFKLPYIAFNHLGQLDSSSWEKDRYGNPTDVFIPLARGTLAHALAADTKVPLQSPPTVQEKPPGNSTNSFTLVHIDRLTGRAKVERQEIQ